MTDSIDDLFRKTSDPDSAAVEYQDLVAGTKEVCDFYTTVANGLRDHGPGSDWSFIQGKFLLFSRNFPGAIAALVECDKAEDGPETSRRLSAVDRVHSLLGELKLIANTTDTATRMEAGG